MDNSYVKNSSVHHSLNRCINLEQTNYLLLENNVGYDAVNHCIALYTTPEQEDRNQFNILKNNLAFDTNTALAKQRVRETENKIATFWITHPNNTFEGNVAGGAGDTNGRVIRGSHAFAGGYGWWFEFNSDKDNYMPGLKRFKDNRAHSNSLMGFHITMPINVPDYANTDTVVDGFVGHHNRINNFWVRAMGLEAKQNKFIVRNSQFADSLSNFYIASGGSASTYSVIELRDSLVVGETENKGTVQPDYDEIVGPDNRTQPINKQEVVNIGTNMIRGVEVYDGIGEFHGITFRNFQENNQRKAAAFTLPYDTSFHMHPDNVVSDITYQNAQRVYLQKEFNRSGSRAFLLRDIDGSTTGKANSYIVGNSKLLRNNKCERRDNWNAYVCPDKPHVIFQVNFIGTPRYETEGIILKRMVDNVRERVSRSGEKNHPINVTNLPLNEWYELEGRYFSDEDGSDLEYPRYYDTTIMLKHARRNGDFIGIKLKDYGKFDGLSINSKKSHKYAEFYSLQNLKNSLETGYFYDSHNEDLYLKVFITDKDIDNFGHWNAHTRIQIRKTPVVAQNRTIPFFAISNNPSIQHKKLPNSLTRTKFCSIITQPKSGVVTIDQTDPHRAIFTPEEKGEFTFLYRPCIEGDGRFLPEHTYKVRVVEPEAEAETPTTPPPVNPKVRIIPSVRIVWNKPHSALLTIEDNTRSFNLDKNSTLEITSRPNVGTVQLNGRKLTYTPPAGGLQEEVVVRLKACNDNGVCGFGSRTYVSGRFQKDINQNADMVISNNEITLQEGSWYVLGVKLTSPPNQVVKVNVNPSNPEFLDSYRREITFTQSNWNTLQPVVIKLKDKQILPHTLTLKPNQNQLAERVVNITPTPKPPKSVPMDPTPNPNLPVPEEIISIDDEISEVLEEDFVESIETLDLDLPEEVEFITNITTRYTPDTDEKVELSTRGGCLGIDEFNILTKEEVSANSAEFTLKDYLYDFTVSCEDAGEDATVDLLVPGALEEGFAVVKLNQSTNTLIDITDLVEVWEVEIEEELFTRIVYQATEGQALDQDSVVNAVLVDPVGLAFENEEGLEEVNEQPSNTEQENLQDNSEKEESPTDDTQSNSEPNSPDSAEQTGSVTALPRTGGGSIAAAIITGVVILSVFVIKVVKRK